MPLKPRPKGMCERIFRNIMCTTTTVTVNGVDYELQGVSYTAYMEANKRFGITGDRKQDMVGYTDWLLKNTVISPKEVGETGVKYFDRECDTSSPLKLFREIETFLQG